VLINRSTWGFKLRLVGFNPRTAQRAGVSAVVVGCLALAIGGGLAGLAGGLMLTGGVANYRYTPGFANNVGWEGLLVALVARNRPLIAIPVLRRPAHRGRVPRVNRRRARDRRRRARVARPRPARSTGADGRTGAAASSGGRWGAG
jgi:hypothetical protein